MGKAKKQSMVGYYTHSKTEGVVEITVPSNFTLPSGIKVHVKEEKQQVYFWLVKQKVVK